MVIVGLAQFRGVHLNTPAIRELTRFTSSEFILCTHQLCKARTFTFFAKLQFPTVSFGTNLKIEIYQTEYYKTYGSNFRNSTSNHAIIKEAHRKPPSTVSRSFLSHAKKDQNKPLLSIWLHYCLNITPVRAH